MRRSSLAALAAALVAVAAPTAARATTFGANLDAHPANNAAGTTCADKPPNYFLIGPSGSPGCQWSFIGTAGESLVPPGGGVVNAVRVKVGATTGKMRVNVIRFLFRQTGDAAHPSSAGPFLEAYGPEFTPAANATTTVPVNLSLKVDPTPALSDLQTIEVIDALALEVEAPNVPFPYFGTGSDVSLLTYSTYPGPTASGTPAPSPNGLTTFNNIGFGVLMNADITLDTPAAGGGGAGGGGGGGGIQPPVTAAPTVGLAKPNATVKDGKAGVNLLCQVVDCSGSIALQQVTGKAARASAAAAKTTKLGSKKFSIKAGSKATVKVPLNAKGRSLIKHSSKVKVQAVITYATGGGQPTTLELTLKR